MRALMLFTLVAAARAGFLTPAVGARFSYGYTAAAPLYSRYNNALGYIRAAPAATYATAPAVAYAAPATGSSQHHSQDELGQYNYGYADVNSAKNEVKTADGVVRGSYSYVDSYGLPQKVDYVSDALGFRVAATNLPVGPSSAPIVPVNTVVDTPEVAAAKAAHFAAHADALARAGRKKRSLPYGYAAPLGAARFGYSFSTVNPIYGHRYAAPAVTYAASPAVTYAAAPVATYAAAPAVAYAAPATGSSQHHSQDELGQYNYGYADVNSAKNEVKTADGVVRGSYSYVDSYGLPQKVDYVSDALGFRVAATNLPAGTVADTPAVAAAKAAHYAAHAEAVARA